MVDTATVIPACGVYNSFFALLTEQEVGCILKQMRVCTKVTKQTAEDPSAHKLAVVYDMAAFAFADRTAPIANVDPMRKFQIALYKEIEQHPNSHVFILEGKRYSHLYATVMASLMCVLAGLGRNVILEIVDDEYAPICGWSKSQFFRTWAAEQKKVSAVMVMGMAKYAKHLVTTLRVPP